MMKNNFYFMSKALFCCHDIYVFVLTFGCVVKQDDKKDKVNFKFYSVTAWLLNNCNTHIAQYLERSKGNQTRKFGQLIECNMRSIFLEKSYRKYGGETSPRPFSEKLKLSISLDQ